MKHQISKVALMATLTFIGIGFAGTQQAKAGDCPKDNCSYFGTRTCTGYAATCIRKTLNPKAWADVIDSASQCLDCDGFANGPNNSCTKHCVKFRTVYYTCDFYDICTDWTPEKAANGDTVYDKFVHQTSGECTVHGTCP